MNPQRPRRPTAWQVSFPGDISDGGGDDGEKEEEGAEWDLEGLDDKLPGKRKPPSNVDVDDRVRSFASSLLSPSSLTSRVFLRNVIAGEAP
jgi:hypothetical protein